MSIILPPKWGTWEKQSMYLLKKVIFLRDFLLQIRKTALALLVIDGVFYFRGEKDIYWTWMASFFILWLILVLISYLNPGSGAQTQNTRGSADRRL